MPDCLRCRGSRCNEIFPVYDSTPDRLLGPGPVRDGFRAATVYEAVVDEFNELEAIRRSVDFSLLAIIDRAWILVLPETISFGLAQVLEQELGEIPGA